ncbi:Uncharacterised protein [Candidatus Burarchaeum australiense]|nr:Uncharacterised protein [Candidatus Burarchaeum australiense]
MKFAIAAFIVLLFAGLASADNFLVSIDAEASAIAILLMISIFIIALAYMASQAFHRPQWETWAKNSGFQVMVSLGLILGVNLMLIAGSSASQALVGANMFTASTNYLNNLAYGQGYPLVNSLIGASIQNQLDSLDFQFNSNPITGAEGSAKSAGKKTLANAQDALMNMLMPLIASLTAQKALLGAIEMVIIPFFLPAAFLLRIFPQTRTMADYLIALSLGLVLVLPLTYVMNIVIVNGNPPLAPGVDMSSIDRTSTPPDLAGIISKDVASDPNLPLAQAASLIPQAVFLPNLAIVITVSFIMAFSKLLSRGFEVEMPNAE